MKNIILGLATFLSIISCANKSTSANAPANPQSEQKNLEFCESVKTEISNVRNAPVKDYVEDRLKVLKKIDDQYSSSENKNYLDKVSAIKTYAQFKEATESLLVKCDEQRTLLAFAVIKAKKNGKLTKEVNSHFKNYFLNSDTFINTYPKTMQDLAILMVLKENNISSFKKFDKKWITSASEAASQKDKHKFEQIYEIYHKYAPESKIEEYKSYRYDAKTPLTDDEAVKLAALLQEEIKFGNETHADLVKKLK